MVSSRHTPCAVTCVLFHLASLLEPLLVLGCCLPALVGRAGADQVHVGAEVLAIRAGAIAGAVRAEAEVLGSDLVERRLRFGNEIAPLIANAAFHRFSFWAAPEFPPGGKVGGTMRRAANVPHPRLQ